MIHGRHGAVHRGCTVPPVTLLSWTKLRAKLRASSAAEPISAPGLDARRPASKPARLDPDLVEIEVPGVGAFRMWRLDGRDQVARDVAAAGLAGFEAPMPAVVAALIQRCGGTVLDVGANTGFYSLLALTCGAERVVAFEPFSPVLAHLRSNLAANDSDVSARVDVVPYAVGAEVGSAVLHIPPPTGTLVETSASLSGSFKDEIARRIEVPVVTVDGHTAVDGPVTVVKVDVEGMDHSVLQGAVRCMREDRPVVFIEVLPRAEKRLLEELVAAANYRILPLHPVEPPEYVDRIEFHPDAHNQMLIPEERTEEMRDLVQRVVIAGPAASAD